MKYIYNNKPVFQILNGEWSRYLRFKRHLQKGANIEEAIKLCEDKQKIGTKTKFFYKNKPLTYWAKMNNIRYRTLLQAYHRGELENYNLEE